MREVTIMWYAVEGGKVAILLCAINKAMESFGKTQLCKKIVREGPKKSDSRTILNLDRVV